MWLPQCRLAGSRKRRSVTYRRAAIAPSGLAEGVRVDLRKAVRYGF